MQSRREFARLLLAGAAASVAGGVASATEEGVQSLVVNSQYHRRPYRLERDGVFREVRFEDIKPGDRILSIGVRAGRVFGITAVTVGPRGCWQEGGVWTCEFGDCIDLLKLAKE